MLAADRFHLLNEEGELSSWNDPARDKLWLYNLHYFDDLNAEGAADRVDWHRALIERWVVENPVGFGNGWEPYTSSLRIVNWVKWALAGNEMSPAWLDSLATQARFLRKRLEVHLLGNHLLANAKALVFAGLYFSGAEAEEWLKKGLGILRREVPEQVLEDGGHFERSPMYHGIILGDLLDLVNVIRVYGAEGGLGGKPGVPEVEFTLTKMIEAIFKMLAWMKAMLHPDEAIGFFNDSSFEIAPTFAGLDGYANRLGLKMPYMPFDDLVNLPDSGFMRVSNDAAVALLDVGEIGPDYLPGHAHADTLSFELSLFGKRCIVNSGISQYGNDEDRLRQRSTAAHNTVEINGENSSEVWGGFRVARRARPFGLRTETTDNAISVTCSHDGYKRLAGKPVHTRHWCFEGGKVTVADVIEGGFKQAVAYYHLHPDTQVSIDAGSNGGEIVLDGHSVAWSVVGGDVCVEDSTWHPEFGLSVANPVIKVVFTGTQIAFTLQWHENGEQTAH